MRCCCFFTIFSNDWGGSFQHQGQCRRYFLLLVCYGLYQAGNVAENVYQEFVGIKYGKKVCTIVTTICCFVFGL